MNGARTTVAAASSLTAVFVLAVLLCIDCRSPAPADLPHSIAAPLVAPEKPSTVRCNRERADMFPDGRVWLRLVGVSPPSATIAIAWDRGTSRSLEMPIPTLAPESDGWWKVPVEPAASHEPMRLAILAENHAVAWLDSPDPLRKHDVALRRLDQFVEIVDAATGHFVADACLRFSRIPTIGEPWRPAAFPGGNAIGSILHTSPTFANAAYRLNGIADRAEYHYELQHPHYVLAKGTPGTIALGGGSTRVLVQMPLVASIRYTGDEMLNGTIVYGDRPSTDRRVIAALQQHQTALRSAHANALTVLFLEDLDRASGPRRREARADCVLRSGARREGAVALVDLARFRWPIEVHVTPRAPPLPLQQVTIQAPPKFSGVAANFKCILRSGDSTRIVKMGDTLNLPPGVYHATGCGDWAYGALSLEQFRVRAGEPTTFELKWREGIHLYKVQTVGRRDVPMIQVECGDRPKRFVVDARVDGEGLAVFWVRSVVAGGRVYAKGCQPVDVRFDSTPDPKVFTGTCELRPQ